MPAEFPRCIFGVKTRNTILFIKREPYVKFVCLPVSVPGYIIAGLFILIACLLHAGLEVRMERDK